jgi:fucose 4-O-acetylase-like acetyltransferase
MMLQQEQLTPEQLQSKVIAWLRFPLIVAVVAIHSTLISRDAFTLADGTLSPSLYGHFAYIIKCCVCDMAVPAFFFISGFLLFSGKPFSRAQYAYKLKKRVSSLLIPYVCWSVLFVGLYFVLDMAMAGTFAKKYGTGQGVGAFLYSVFWSTASGQPSVGAFWYIRDLMVVCVYSPLLYFFLKTFRFYGVALIGVLFLLGVNTHLTGVSMRALFFCAWGGYFSIAHRNFLVDFKPLYRWMYVVCPLLIAAEILRLNFFSTLPPLLNLIHIIGIISIMGITVQGINSNRLRVVPALWAAGFFVYGFHGIFVGRVPHVLLLKYLPHDNFSLLLAWLLFLVGVVGICVCLYHLSRYLFPRFTALICGGR